MALLAALLGGAAGTACGSPSSSAAPDAGSCVGDPGQCPAGTTCWPADAVPHLQCLPSDPGSGFGAACQLRIGQASCADGLTCDQTTAASGSCVYYCGATGRACPTGYDCRETRVGTDGPAIDLCRPQPMVGGPDGGPDDGGPSGPDAADGSPVHQ